MRIDEENITKQMTRSSKELVSTKESHILSSITKVIINIIPEGTYPLLTVSSALHALTIYSQYLYLLMEKINLTRWFEKYCELGLTILNNYTICHCNV